MFKKMIFMGIFGIYMLNTSYTQAAEYGANRRYLKQGFWAGITLSAIPILYSFKQQQAMPSTQMAPAVFYTLAGGAIIGALGSIVTTKLVRIFVDKTFDPTAFGSQLFGFCSVGLSVFLISKYAPTFSNNYLMLPK